MHNKDIKIALGNVQEILMLPPWASAQEAKQDNPIVVYSRANKIIQSIGYGLLTDTLRM